LDNRWFFDLIFVPIGISFALKLIPKEVIEECRKKAMEEKELL